MSRGGAKKKFKQPTDGHSRPYVKCDSCGTVQKDKHRPCACGCNTGTYA